MDIAFKNAFKHLDEQDESTTTTTELNDHDNDDLTPLQCLMRTAWIPLPVEVPDYWKAVLEAQNQRGEAGCEDVPRANLAKTRDDPSPGPVTGHAKPSYLCLVASEPGVLRADAYGEAGRGDVPQVDPAKTCEG